MNREQRRAAARRGPNRHPETQATDDEIRAAAASYKCPDCNADTSLSQDGHGIWHLDIAHDDTCPTFQRIRRMP